MYSLLRSQSFKGLIATQLPSFGLAFLIAELFYKFKSFALECLAFLVTWYVLDWAWSRLRGAFAGNAESTSSGNR